MKKRDITLIAIMLIGASILVLLPEAKKYEKEICPYTLIDKATHKDKYISADELAKTIMRNDPSVILLDVRSDEEFESFNLPGSMCIPIDYILFEEYLEELKNDAYTFVIYSNGSIKASKAWLLLRRIGLTNIKVLEGGLNNWIETILRPQKLDYMSIPEEDALYQFRVSASKYFGEAEVEAIQTANGNAPAPIIKRQKKEVGGGGCD